MQHKYSTEIWQQQVLSTYFHHVRWQALSVLVKIERCSNYPLRSLRVVVKKSN